MIGNKIGENMRKEKQIEKLTGISALVKYY